MRGQGQGGTWPWIRARGGAVWIVWWFWVWFPLVRSAAKNSRFPKGVLDSITWEALCMEFEQSTEETNSEVFVVWNRGTGRGGIGIWKVSQGDIWARSWGMNGSSLSQDGGGTTQQAEGTAEVKVPDGWRKQVGGCELRFLVERGTGNAGAQLGVGCAGRPTPGTGTGKQHDQMICNNISGSLLCSLTTRD